MDALGKKIVSPKIKYDSTVKLLINIKGNYVRDSQLS